MALRIWLAPPRMQVMLPMIKGPVETYYTLLDGNEIGGCCRRSSHCGSRFKGYGWRWVISILRSTGVIRWTATGADKDPLEDREGTCSVDLPSWSAQER